MGWRPDSCSRHGNRWIGLATFRAGELSKRKQHIPDAPVWRECGKCHFCRDANTPFPIASNISVANRALVA